MLALMLQDRWRVPGRLILVDGSDGRSLGRYMNLTRRKDTKISPILHTTKDGSQYILYGSGGETVKGRGSTIEVTQLFHLSSARCQ